MESFVYKDDDHKTAKVLLVCDTHPSIWEQVLQFIVALNRAGVEVHLAAAGPLTDDKRLEISRMHAAELYEITLGCAARNQLAEMANWLLSIEQRLRPDIVHLFEPCYGSLKWQSPTVVTVDTCELSWASAVRGRDMTAAMPRYWKAIARGLHGANIVVTPSEDFRRRLSQIYGRPKRSAVIYHGRDSHVEPDGEKRSIVVGCGEWRDPAQNLSLLEQIATCAELPVYLAATDGPEFLPERNGSMRSGGKLNSREIAMWLRVAEIAVFPALHDPTGLLPLEAATAGCALVLSDSPVFKEVWGEAAAYAAPNDAASFAAAINSIAQHPWRRKTLGIAARTRAAEYRPGRMAKDYLETYKQLIIARNDARIHQVESIA